MEISKIELIFDKWKASLRTRDRSFPNVATNFEELFEELKNADATFEEAHSILTKAIKAHQPPVVVAKKTYQTLKATKALTCSEKEYIDDWNQSISDVATNSFYIWYPITKDDDDDSEPKAYGSMSVKEYRMQRSYADSFPTLDTTELEERMKNRQYNLDIEDLIKNVLRKKEDETNT